MVPISARCLSSACASRFAPDTRCTLRRSRRAHRRRISPCRPRELEGDGGLRDDRERLDGSRVSSARRALRPAHSSRDRRCCNGRISVGSGFMAARTTISSPFDTPASMPPARFESRSRPESPRPISSCAAEPRTPGEREAVADLDALHRLNAHQRRRQPGIEAARRARRTTRARAARRAPRTSTMPPIVSRSMRASSTALGERLQVDDATLHRGADLRPAASSRRAPAAHRRRRLTRARALQRVADILELRTSSRSGEVGMAGARRRDGCRPFSGRLALRRPRAHPPCPVLVVSILDPRARAACQASSRA